MRMSWSSYVHACSAASAMGREAIFESMRHWEEKTCIRFKRRTQEKDYVEITNIMDSENWYVTV